MNIMEPISTSEKLLFNTIRITTDTGCGTGFFFTFVINNLKYPILITNKHVINYNPYQKISLTLHLTGEGIGTNQNVILPYAPNWFFHSSKDLCFCFMGNLFSELAQNNSIPYYIPADETLLATNDITNDLDALEEVTMVGYPIGLYDKQNNLPIFRKGYTASHPNFDFNQQGIALVDMACFPGSSGSPIYIYDKSSYTDKRGTTIFGQKRLLLLGILFAGPKFNAHGNIEIVNIPTVQSSICTNTPIMTNLGYYIKAAEILEFKDIIESIINKTNNN